jgi:hypothetical protein
MSFKNFKSSVLEGLVNLILPAVGKIVKAKLKDGLKTLKEKSPETYESVLIGLYRPVAVNLEQIADKTETELDDTVVDAMKEAIEESALESGITLPPLT